MYRIMSGLYDNTQILDDISYLRQMEQEMFSYLESNPNLSTDEQKKIIDKMDQLSKMRINLYKTLRGVNEYYGNTIDSSIGTLQQQQDAVNIVSNELTFSQQRLDSLEAEKNQKIRLAEINNYYGDKYEEHSLLMKVIIFTLLPIIVISYLNRKNILPNTIYYILLVIVAVIGAYYFWSIFASIIMRDNMNYQRYDWPFRPDKAPKAPQAPSTVVDPWASSGIDLSTCVGSSCCSVDMVYDSILNKCVRPTPASGAATTGTSTSGGTTDAAVDKEGFIQSVLTKVAPYKYGRIDYNLNQPAPFNNYF